MAKNVSLKAIMYHMWFLRYCTKPQMARLLYGESEKREGPDGAVNRQTKAGQRLNKLVELGKLEKVGDKPAVFKLPGLRGEGGDHALKVTDVLVDTLRCYPKTIIEREYTIGSSRPDAVVLIRTREKTFPLILEVMLNESKASILQKLEDYKQWDGAWFLQRNIPFCGVLIIGDIVVEDDGVTVAREFKRELLYG